ncbi:hypothetical protein CEP54_013169 [Fusarium duplospermum]|uniref:Uncharacterized protein n=1 Tax=Fusarium duplospermum TaxID=1325734 RepID=A0A428P4H0_9HYPO|nr:hypothetical protein CEP54_013169 [Fusarium duplospermum]
MPGSILLFSPLILPLLDFYNTPFYGIFGPLAIMSHARAVGQYDRVRQTAQWIVAEAERNHVGRAVVCGDLLTSRTIQPTHMLSAYYRFVSLLSDIVPRVHIVLGNHDLAYRCDYQTTALNALNIKRLAPYVSLHSVVAHHEWDGQRVLLLPFREEQNELTEAVAALGPNEASKTVAFAHLAINKAITQRYIVGAGVDNPHTANSITHRGLTGPNRFASLARTFGHFHSHQTITEQQSDSNKVDLQGSVTYLGSPLQLSWADLYDEQRGVVLFDPETLEHELLVNPHAVGYITADLQQVLSDQVDEGAVADKHVMLIGKLTHLKYVTARDKLLSLGVRSVRSWTPMVSREIADQDIEHEVNHQYFLDRSLQVVGTRTATELAGPSTHVFVAEPRTLTITNFLGAQNTINIDFRQDLPRGLTFLVGDNGSGKSTLVEAMAWCQFGRCIRGGLAANDVVNDKVGKDCSVKLEFGNGYAIAWYRKHKI